ncbi:MAG: hypothetical protein ACYS0H_30835, partial [Planctomycetota bacterium]
MEEVGNGERSRQLVKGRCGDRCARCLRACPDLTQSVGADWSAGRRMAIRIAIIAITTNNSIRIRP